MTRHAQQALWPHPIPTQGRATHQRGISLTEVCISLVVICVLSAWAAPSLGRFLNTMGGDFASRLVASLQLARSEAIKTGGRATVCKSGDGVRCSNSGHWGQGWIVFHDDNHSGQREASERLIDVREALGGGWTIKGNASISDYVSFRGDGMPAQLNGAFQAGTFSLCRVDGSPESARLLVMSATGRARIQRASVPACG